MNDAALAAPLFVVNPPGSEDEAGLIARARRRELGAFEALYRSHVGRIHALCRRLSGSPSLAEDYTQEAFVRAWESLPGFRGESAFGSWLHKIAVNVVLGKQRLALRRSAWIRDDPREEDEEAIAAIAAPGERPDIAMDLERAIAELPPGAREVFVLYDVEGYQHEEIAALTGLAVGTSKAHLHRARRQLRARLTS
ncbi:MAG TPA: RNA polymerase sigma factor [Gammaproteobacteria bacterium]|nr:RNA polymerase sigma factor [Gammaproteobacteria bacterium]